MVTTSEKEALNTCVRPGLDSRSDTDLATAFCVEARPMGLRPGTDLDDIGGLLDLLDGPAHRRVHAPAYRIP